MITSMIRNSVTEIADDAFDGNPELVIYGALGSEAERYAAEHDMVFITE